MQFPACVLTRRRRLLLLLLMAFLSIGLIGLLGSHQDSAGDHIALQADVEEPDTEKVHAKRLIEPREKEKLDNIQGEEEIVEDDNSKNEGEIENDDPLFFEEESVATPSVKMADHSHGFDCRRVFELFSSCRGEGDVISIDCYVDAYEELCKLFRLFGTIFGFVTSDVEEKIGILRDYRKSENAGEYKTIQSMLQYEVTNELTKNKKKPSGSRTLLRLHRAMEFISAFLVKLKESDNNVRFSSVATKAYDETLAKHHPWLVKKAVHVAMYMLPTRPDLLKKMGVEENKDDMQGITDLVTELNLIFKITEGLYAKDSLLDLP